MTDVQRPTRVVVVDADNPLDEIRGEFYWLEDHEQLLAAARESAYRAGFDQGFVAGSMWDSHRVRFVPVRWSGHILRRVLGSLVAVAFVLLLIGTMLR